MRSHLLESFCIVCLCVSQQRYCKTVADQKEAGTLRKSCKSGAMSKERQAQLESIGFQWKVAPPITGWNNRYEQLMAYKAANGHCNVPQYYKPDKYFGRWVMKVTKLLQWKATSVQTHHIQTNKTSYPIFLSNATNTHSNCEDSRANSRTNANRNSMLLAFVGWRPAFRKRASSTTPKTKKTKPITIGRATMPVTTPPSPESCLRPHSMLLLCIRMCHTTTIICQQRLIIIITIICRPPIIHTR